MSERPSGTQPIIEPGLVPTPIRLPEIDVGLGELGVSSTGQPTTSTAATAPATEPLVQISGPNGRVCAMCGNEYPRLFEVITHEGNKYWFDSFECAIHHLAPKCSTCGCRVVGHGVESSQGLFCCASCARRAGESRLVDTAT